MKQGMVTWLVVLFALALVVGTATAEPQVSGDVRVGWTFTDEQGNLGVYQPTYNLYDGPIMSLEDFSYRLDNGLRLYGDLRNLTLNNRNLRAGATRSGQFGISVRHNKYQRRYSFDGDMRTRRENTYGEAWFQPRSFVKFFGGYGYIQNEGERTELFEPNDLTSVNAVNYAQNQFHVGTQVNYQKSWVKAEYRQTSFTDDLNDNNDRSSNRFRITASSPVPRYPFVLLNGGFQMYERNIDLSNDTLTANTVWAGARYFNQQGFSVRYSFIWDRAERTGDAVATDNLMNAVYAGKVWRGMGGVTVGYRFGKNDDYYVEKSTTGYYGSGWYNVMPELKLEANFGSDETEIDAGRTLVGQESFTRYRGAATYKFDIGRCRASYAMRKTENEDIGSEATYGRFSVDFYAEKVEWGRLTASYAYLDGDYTNEGGVFEFRDHTIDADVFATYHHMVDLGVGTTYYRSQQDLDIESFAVRLTGVYHFRSKHRVEVTYTAHNFDDLAANRLPYTEYYTANVVSVSVVHEL